MSPMAGRRRSRGRCRDAVAGGVGGRAARAACNQRAEDRADAAEKVAVTIAAQTAATEQGSQAPLFANLASVANSPALPPKLLQAVQQVLAQQTDLDPNLSGADIKAAFQKSGLFLEASLRGNWPSRVPSERQQLPT